MKYIFFILFSFLLFFSTKAQSLQFLFDFAEKIKVDTIIEGERKTYTDIGKVSLNELRKFDNQLTNYLEKEEIVKKKYIQIIEEQIQKVFVIENQELNDLLINYQGTELKKALLKWKSDRTVFFEFYTLEEEQKEKLITLFEELKTYKNDVLSLYLKDPENGINDFMILIQIDMFFEEIISYNTFITTLENQ